MTAHIRFLKKNYRYRLVRYDWDYYILDTERNLLSIFFPWLFWFTKHTLYSIDHETGENLRVIAKTVDKSSRFHWNHLAMVLLLPLLRPIYEQVVSIPWLNNELVLWIIAGICVGLRLFIHKSSENKFIDEKIHLAELPQHSVKLKPKHVSQWGYHLGMTLIFDLAVLFSIYFYWTENLLGALLSFILFLPIRLFIFSLFFANPSVKNSEEYYLKRVDT